MSLFNKLFRKNEKQDTDDITVISKKVAILLDTTADKIFLEHRKILLEDEIVYIVYAVWGAKKDGELSQEQLLIHQKVLPVISQVKQLIGLKGQTPQQAYTVDSLIRSVLINRITFMIAHFKESLCQFSHTHAPSLSETAPSATDIDMWLNNLHVTENNPWWKRMRFDNGAMED